jgi:hypothetical protein
MLKLLFLELQFDQIVETWTFLPEDIALKDHLAPLLPCSNDIHYTLVAPNLPEVGGWDNARFNSYQKIICSPGPCAVQPSPSYLHSEYIKYDVVFHSIPRTNELFLPVNDTGEQMSDEEPATIRWVGEYGSFRMQLSYSKFDTTLIFVLAFNEAGNSTVFLLPSDLAEWIEFSRKTERQMLDYKYIFHHPVTECLYLANKTQIDSFKYNQFQYNGSYLFSQYYPGYEIRRVHSSGPGPAVLIARSDNPRRQMLVCLNAGMERISELELDAARVWTEFAFVDGKYLLLSESGQLFFHGEDKPALPERFTVMVKERNGRKRFVCCLRGKEIFDWNPGTFLSHCFSNKNKIIYTLTEEKTLRLWPLNPELAR